MLMLERGGRGGDVGWMGRFVALFILTLAALLIPACATIPKADADGAPREIAPLVDGARRIMPPSGYAAAWFEAEQCSGRRGNIRAVTWYIVDTKGRGVFPCRSESMCMGVYRVREHAIYIADLWAEHAWLIRHESLHALGVIGHPWQLFWACARPWS